MKKPSRTTSRQADLDAERLIAKPELPEVGAQVRIRRFGERAYRIATVVEHRADGRIKVETVKRQARGGGYHLCTEYVKPSDIAGEATR